MQSEKGWRSIWKSAEKELWQHLEHVEKDLRLLWQNLMRTYILQLVDACETFQNAYLMTQYWPKSFQLIGFGFVQKDKVNEITSKNLDKLEISLRKDMGVF